MQELERKKKEKRTKKGEKKNKNLLVANLVGMKGCIKTCSRVKYFLLFLSGF